MHILVKHHKIPSKRVWPVCTSTNDLWLYLIFHSQTNRMCGHTKTTPLKKVRLKISVRKQIKCNKNSPAISHTTPTSLCDENGSLRKGFMKEEKGKLAAALRLLQNHCYKVKVYPKYENTEKKTTALTSYEVIWLQGRGLEWLVFKRCGFWKR